MQGLTHSYKRASWLAAIAVTGLVTGSLQARADADAEREALARLAHEVEALEPVIKTAEAQASPDARIRFRYDWLRQDLERVRAGIQEHIDAPRAEPRTFPPLRGDYRR
ncbi:MAG: RAQPRD family integrative conjugative element protein [Gammaproteobacteria bacterium]